MATMNRPTAKAYRAGNSVSIRMPRGVAPAIGTEFDVQVAGDVYTLVARPKFVDLTGIWGSIPDLMVDGRGDTEQEERDWHGSRPSSRDV